jgi:hypothetical protein
MQTIAEHADLQTTYERRLARCMRYAAFLLRITEWKALPVPVLVIKERQGLSQIESTSQLPLPLNGQSRGTLVERGHLAGEALRVQPAYHALHPGAGLR